MNMVPMREGEPYQLTTGEWVVMYEFGIFPAKAPPEKAGIGHGDSRT